MLTNWMELAKRGVTALERIAAALEAMQPTGDVPLGPAAFPLVDTTTGREVPYIEEEVRWPVANR